METITMTAKQQAALLGQEIDVRCDGLTVACLIQDVKQAYGKMRFQVTPVNGDGLIWIEDSRIMDYDRLMETV